MTIHVYDDLKGILIYLVRQRHYLLYYCSQTFLVNKMPDILYAFDITLLVTIIVRSIYIVVFALR